MVFRVREFRPSRCDTLSLNYCTLPTFSGVLAGGTFPGPLIQANKAWPLFIVHQPGKASSPFQGDELRINVVNQLYDTWMNTTTSIVSLAPSRSNSHLKIDMSLALAWHFSASV